MNSRIYDAYKPLRNFLTNLEIEDSLYVIWAYSVHLQFEINMPENIEMHGSFKYANILPKIIQLPEWKLEKLAIEVIINSQHKQIKPKTLRKWKILAKTINSINDLEGIISKQFVNEKNILDELFRTAHIQFPWQLRINHKTLYRYYFIYNNSIIDSIFERKVGMKIDQIYLSGLSLSGAFLNRFSIINKTSVSSFKIFIEKFSIHFDDLRKKLISEQSYDEKYFYTFSSLRKNPIIFNNGKYYCPFPTLLLWRLTSGLYYEICNEDDFGDAFGSSFQNYIGKVIEKALSDSSINYLPEESYNCGRDRKDTIDFFIYDNSAVLFVECKTKRLIQPAKEELFNSEFIENELEKMADFIVQTYKTINDFLTNKYPTKYNNINDIIIYPLIVTLEDWYLMGDKIFKFLDLKIEEKLEAFNIPKEYLRKMPCSFASIQEFENIMELIGRIGIDTFFKNKNVGEKQQWTFDSYMNTEYKKELRNNIFLFENEFNEFMSIMTEQASQMTYK